MTEVKTRVAALPCWKDAVEPIALDGGITNVNFTVLDGRDKFVVRVGDDIPQHQVMRFNERAASVAAYKAGLSPEVVYTEPGILVMRFIEGRTLGAEDIARPEMLERIIPVLKTCHQTIPKFLTGPALIFWVFHVLRDYAHTLRASNSSHRHRLERLEEIASELGTAREVISRVLHDFQKRGLIVQSRGRITLSAKPALRAIAESD